MVVLTFLCVNHQVGQYPPLWLRSPLWAAGFSFMDGTTLLEVPYSPLLHHLFFGEEISMAAR